MFRKKEPKPNSKLKSIIKPIGILGLGAVLFLSGYGIGSGRIIISKNQLFKQSVQKGLPEDLDYKDVESVYDALKKSYDGQLERDELYDGLKAGLASAAGDPYTEYLTAKEAKEFDSDLNGTFVGIGAELQKDVDNNIIIYSPVPGFPAERAGLKAKDIIVEINDKPATGIGIKEAVDQIRGEEGTKVKLKIVRDKSKALDFEITRAKITVPSVTTKLIDGNIGYIRLTRYAEDTAKLAEAAAQDFKKQNVKGIILDVRNNGGGYLEAAVAVSGIWLEPGKTVLVEKRADIPIKTYKSSGKPVLVGVPTIVLINEGSASASEITAGALRDNKAATLIGVKSYGKGSVQQLLPFDNGSMLKVTVARWFTPAGVNINKEGIKPDKEVKISDDDAKASRDPQLDAAQAALKSR